MIDHKTATKRFQEFDTMLLAAKDEFLSFAPTDVKGRTLSYERFRDVRREWAKATTDLFEATT